MVAKGDSDCVDDAFDPEISDVAGTAGNVRIFCCCSGVEEDEG